MRKSIMLASALGLAIAGHAHASTVIPGGANGATALYMTDASEVSTSQLVTESILLSFLGAPDDDYTGIGEEWVTYDLGTYRMVDGLGQDFNVYEYNAGSVEFNDADILVSADNMTWFNVESTSGAAIDLAGDEAHNSPSFRRSYDLGGAVIALGASEFRYLRIDGTASGSITGSNDFDLDAVGFANFIETQQAAVPEPQTWALMLAGFGFVGGAMRRRKAASNRKAYAA